MKMLKFILEFFEYKLSTTNLKFKKQAKKMKQRQ